MEIIKILQEELTVSSIEYQIEKSKNVYLTDSSRVIADYRAEKQYTADYNGRQLLELLQNADDAKTDSIQISLDTNNKVLSIANMGIPFSLAGIKSLMLANMSSKNKQEFIGNKGLGFRSILNWVSKVQVVTKQVVLTFSHEHTNKEFQSLINQSEDLERMVKQDKNLTANEVPLALLAFPKVSNTSKDVDWETKIILHYNDDEQNHILSQIEAIQEETLLFLRHTQQIEISIDGREKTFQKDIISNNKIRVNDKVWNVYKSGNKNLGEHKKYSFQIAWQDDLSDVDTVFYTYFPTDVKIHLPCIIHATFDLNASRKEINNNRENLIILNDIAESLGDIALDNLSNIKPANWNAYTFLNQVRTSDTKILEEFYQTVQGHLKTLAIYPSVDGEYYALDQLFNHGQTFSNWVVKKELGSHFKKMLLVDERHTVYVHKRFNYDEFYEIIEPVNSVLTLEDKTELLCIMVKNNIYFDFSIVKKTYFPLLIDSEGNTQNIETTVFTKGTEELKLDLPEFVNDIAFISTNQYKLIEKILHEEIKLKKQDNESGSSRAIKRLLNDYVNIGSDDITDVISQIVSQTNSLLRQTYDIVERQNLVKELIRSLFSIYKSNPNRRGNLTSITNMPMVTRAGTIAYTNKLYLGDVYGVHQETEIIFEGIRTEQDYIQTSDFWDLDVSIETVSAFFKWLNVSKVSHWKKVSESYGVNQHDDFTNYILDLKQKERKKNKTFDFEKIEGFNDILYNPLFSIEKLIAWVAIDEKLKTKLNDYLNKETFEITYHSSKEIFDAKPSFIKYQIENSKLLENTILNFPIKIDQLKTINQEAEVFKKLNIQPLEINNIAVLLGVKSSFNDLEPDKVYQMLQQFSEHKIPNSQQVYKMFYEYFKVNENSKLVNYTPSFTGLKYLARKGGQGKDFELQPVEKVYYSDNNLLPQKILNKYWFINLPKRTGENRVAKFFGVNKIKEAIEQISIQNPIPNTLDQEFNRYINLLKPYILSYRLENLKDIESKKTEANIIKSLKIELVKSVEFKIRGTALETLDNYEFIPKDNQYYLALTNENSIEELKKDPRFCDAIAEIFTITCKVNDLKNTFRSIFKDGIYETEHIIKMDEKELYLSEAKQLLGISPEEQFFWSKVFPGLTYDVSNKESLIQEIKSKINTEFFKEYDQVNFSNLTNSIGVEFLAWILANTNVNLESLIHKNDLFEYHKSKIKNAIANVAKCFEIKLWEKANNATDIIEKQTYFSNLIEFLYSETTTSFNTFLEEHAYNLNPDYNMAVVNYAQFNFGVNIADHLEIPTSKLPKTKYNHIIKEYSFGTDVVDMEKIIKDKSIKMYSLLYFDGFYAEIKNIADQLSEEYRQDKSEIGINNQVDDFIVTTGTSFEKGSTSSNTHKYRKNQSFSYSSIIDRKKSKVGAQQEDKVIIALENIGYEIYDESKKTDSKHYDLKYKEKGATEWRYLEVKKDSGGYFFLSKAEKETAMSAEHASKYDIALVNGHEIEIIKAPFNFDKDTFENNPSFYAIPTEYKISFKKNKS